MQNNRLLRIAPMVLTVHMVAGVSFRGTTFGPWKQYSMLSSNTSLSKEASEAFPTESSSAIVLSTIQLVSSNSDFKTLTSIVLKSGNETSSRSFGTKTQRGTLRLSSMSDSAGAMTYLLR